MTHGSIKPKDSFHSCEKATEKDNDAISLVIVNEPCANRQKSRDIKLLHNHRNDLPGHSEGAKMFCDLGHVLELTNDRKKERHSPSPVQEAAVKRKHSLYYV